MIPAYFEIDGVWYLKDGFGVIHQNPPEVSQIYNRKYVETRYDAIPDRVRHMSFLRAGYIVGTIHAFRNILDIGYGNGDFLATLKLWRSWNVECWGYDVSHYPLPKDCLTAKWEDLSGKRWDVVTFFDSLEHMASLDFLSRLQANYIVVTAPFCHAERLGLNWFRNWKHRRPGEHLHHFSRQSIANYMRQYGYRMIAWQALEDAIRQPVNGNENTFTAVFKSC